MQLKGFHIFMYVLLSGFLPGSLIFAQDQIFQQGLLPEEVVQGEVLSILIRTDNRAEPPRLTIKDQEGNYVAGCYGFRLPAPPGLALYQMIVGIPVLQAVGEYSLQVSYQSAEHRVVREGSLSIQKGPYPEETIYLNPATTAMLTTPDPRKQEQSERLSAVILDFSEDSLFHLEPFIAPIVEGRETSIFGAIRTFRYSNGKITHSYHRGHDWAAPTGTPVIAPGSGVVRLAENRIVTGNTVVIEHLPGVYSMLFHLNSLSVEEGQYLEQGDEVGGLGSTGLSTGPHVHWEIRIHGVPVNPKLFLERGLLDKTCILSKIHKYIF